MLRVKDYMSREIIAVSPINNIAYVRNLMLKHRVGRVVIVENNKPVGIVTKRDISRSLAKGRAKWKRRPIDKILIKRIMSKNLVTIGKDEELKKAAELMLENGISSLIVKNEILEGIITKTDLVKAYSENYQGKFLVKDLMSSKIITVSPYNTINHIVEMIEENNISRVIVVDGTKVVGIVTSTDLSFAFFGEREKEIKYLRRPRGGGRAMLRVIKILPIITAEDIMSTELITISPSEDAAKASNLMLKEKISGLPVLKDEELRGIITKTDILRGIAR